MGRVEASKRHEKQERLWRDVLEGNEVQHEEGRELSGGLVVKFKVSDRKAEGVKERQDSFEGGDVCRRSARLHGVIVDKATVESDENILVNKIRRDRKTTSEVGGSPFRGGILKTPEGGPRIKPPECFLYPIINAVDYNAL